jgi:uncharacterized protein
MPWKNGGGITREVAAFPDGANFDSFDWRVSIATVSADGPFSQLPNIERRLVLLEGRLFLQIGDQAAIELSSTSPPIALSGDVATYARPLVGPATDLNVMTRRGRYRSTLLRRALHAPLTVQTSEEHTVIVVTEPVSIEHQGSASVLQALDAVAFQGISNARLAPISGASVCYVIDFVEIGPQDGAIEPRFQRQPI